MSRTIHCYDYVNHPYAQVRDALLADPQQVFRVGTAAATSQAASLHARIAGLEVGKDIEIRVSKIAHDATSRGVPATQLTIEWSAITNAGMFPTMFATLSLFPLTSTETQLALEGTYFLPFGMLGQAIDSVLGHKVAEESVTRFVQEVAGCLRDALVSTTAATA